MVNAPHVEKIFETRDLAIEAGEQYGILYPENRSEIERVLRVRRSLRTHCGGCVRS